MRDTRFTSSCGGGGGRCGSRGGLARFARRSRKTNREEGRRSKVKLGRRAKDEETQSNVQALDSCDSGRATKMTGEREQKALKRDTIEAAWS